MFGTGAEIAVVFAAYGAAPYSAALCYAQPRRSERAVDERWSAAHSRKYAQMLAPAMR
jgi:hypothetical protein